MKIQFWGVRGSLPTPTTPSRIKSKISAIVEQITPEDIVNAESRERFLAGLPPWLFGTVGGNTTCLSVALDNPQEIIVFDCGTGLRELGISSSKGMDKVHQYHIFLTHFHWDHLQGYPFFNPAYDPSVNIDFYSPKPDLEINLNGQMNPPYFPVTMESMGSKKIFHILEKPVNIGGAIISWKKMSHPGDSYSYKVDNGKYKFIFSTDSELSTADFTQNEENVSYFQDADLLVLDSQYTLGEAIEKYNWGHTAFSMAVDFAAHWGIKHLVLFHHDPTYDDKKLFNNLQSARWYMERMNIYNIKLSLAIEGLEIEL